MRAIVTIFILTLLSGCASHQQTLYDEERGVYYADEGVYYEVPASLNPGSSYAGFAAYPWWSMDYFYLGHHPYRPWTFTYYSPYYYPHYFSVLYPPWHWRPYYGYGSFYAWHDPYWYYRYRQYYVPVMPHVVETGIDARRVVVSGGQSGGMTVISPETRKEMPSRIGPTTPNGLSAAIDRYPVGSAGWHRPKPAASGVVAPSKSANKATSPARKAPYAGTKPFRYDKNHPVKFPTPSSANRSSALTPANGVPKVQKSSVPPKLPNSYRQQD